MKIRLLIYTCMLLSIALFGCGWNNGAALIDNDGRYYYSNVSFNPEYQTGTIHSRKLHMVA